jgi:hypothetical protein
MMTVKELFENEELMHNIVEEIEEIPADTEVFYAVWALGHNDNDGPTEDEVLVGEFTDPDEAVAYAEKVTLDTINEMGYGNADTNTAYFSVEVETVIADPDDEDGGTMNIGTVYSRDLWLDGEYGSDEDAPDYGDPIVSTGKDDYELLEDGTLKLSAKFMKGFNKNDMIRVQFLGEPDVDLLPYKIVSKVEYADGDYYHCELMI